MRKSGRHPGRRIIDQWWKKGSTDTDRFKYGYDQNSNRIWKDVVGTNAPTDVDEYYVYDNLNRLMRANRGTLSGERITNGSATWYQEWGLDALGNWASFNDNGTSQTRTHDFRNEITGGSALSVTPAYDANGNQIEDETGKDYLYDAWNRVVGVDANGDGDFTDNGDVKYRYDALNRRISEETIGGTATHLYYSAEWQVLEERAGASTAAKKQNVWGVGYVDAMVLRDRDATSGGDLGLTGSGLDERLYVQQDANFNVTSIMDSSSTVQERYLYDPYGAIIADTTPRPKRSDSIGLHDMCGNGRRRHDDVSRAVRVQRNSRIGLYCGLSHIMCGSGGVGGTDTACASIL